MTLKEHIDDIREGLDKDIFVGEAAVSQGIVLRLLNALTWPTYNTQVVTPTYRHRKKTDAFWASVRKYSL
ncbi:MAG: hypothetical protein OXH00_00395 [Candidatus Poribacteria bacterium]|nr:hypothetical protein [Candidatus Poribacteria bacterium]